MSTTSIEQTIPPGMPPQFEKNNEGKLVLSETWKKWVRETVPNNFEEIIKNAELQLEKQGQTQNEGQLQS